VTMQRKQRILIAEDEPVAALKLQVVLEQAGYDVQRAANGEEALELLDKSLPDMIISDVIMPGMDGYRLCRKIRTTEAYHGVLVVLLTSHTDPGDVLLGLSVGADNYIVKPYEPKDLLECVRQMLSSRSERLRDEPADGVEVMYHGTPYIINANRLQVLNFFINTYETQFRHQQALVSARDELAMLSRNLEHKVQERTVELTEEIRERKRAERRISEQAALLDLAHDAIMVASISGEVFYWNRSAERLYGWSAGQAVGKSIRELVMGGDESVETAPRAAMRRGEGWTGEMVHCAKGGAQITVQSSWTPVRDANGTPNSFLMINTDISQKKLLEAEVIRTQRMESIGMLAGGIAHDLNNVLGPIMLAMGLLKQDARDENARKMLTLVEESAQRGAEMVKQVLMFGRGVDGARIMLQPRHLVRELRKIIEQSFPKNIQIHVMTPKDVPCVMADPTQLNQALLNLCVNARDAMPQGGVLSLSVAAITLDAQSAALDPGSPSGAYILLKVTDTGVGIPREARELVFEPFYTTKELGGGTGLGLSTVVAIVRSHGGFVRVDSEIGKGTSFEVYLPAMTRKSEEGAEHSGDSNGRGHGETILVVDDEQIVREITKVTLEDNGYRVLTAKDGVEALAMYAKHGDSIDVVLTDLVMPRLDGASTIQALRQSNPDVKVIASSGLNAEEKRAGAMPLPGVPLLEKPFTAKMLLTKLAEVLG
jgi:two-component system, cell cycle sensor histidine kinase and response regulator CckA